MPGAPGRLWTLCFMHMQWIQADIASGQVTCTLHYYQNLSRKGCKTHARTHSKQTRPYPVCSVHMSLRSDKIGRPTCVLHNLPTMSTVQCNTQMQVHFLFLKNTDNDSMVDLMACRGSTFPVISAYNVTFSWPHR